MPSFYPTASYNSRTPQQLRLNFRPWKARVKEDWREIFLGWFESREAAEAAERKFRDSA